MQGQIQKRVSEMLDARIIIGIIISVISFHVASQLFFEQSEINAVDFAIFGASLSVIGICAWNHRHFRKIRSLSKANIALLLAFGCILAGDAIYLIYDTSEKESPFLSIADIFYFAFPILIGICILYSFYHLTDTPFEKRFFVFSFLVCGIMSGFFYIQTDLNEVVNDNGFYFGFSGIVITSFVLGMLLYMLSRLQGSVYGVIRMVLFGGILLNLVADMWYYSLETYGLYEPMHVVDTMWFASWLIIAYSVYLHGKRF